MMRFLAFIVPLFLMIWRISSDNFLPFPPFGLVPHPIYKAPPKYPPPTPIKQLPPVRAPVPGGGRMVRCRNPAFPACYEVQLPCPPIICPRTCVMDCATCRPVCSCNYPGAVCEDPRLVGGDGNTFYFHGHKDQDFCLVTDPNLHINGHFIGKRNPSLKRDFTWVQSLGILFNNHKLLLAAEKTSTWDDNVDRLNIAIDNTTISLSPQEGATWKSSSQPVVTITRTKITNGVTIEVENNFRINAVVVPISAEESRVHGYNISKDDCFAHLEIGFKFYNVSEMVDGVLGQTYRSDYVSKTRVDVPMPVMGGTSNHLSSGIFATDCAVSRFGQNIQATPGDFEGKDSSMSCSSGINGSGLVCKK